MYIPEIGKRLHTCTKILCKDVLAQLKVCGSNADGASVWSFTLL